MPGRSGQSKLQPSCIGRFAVAHQFRCLPHGSENAGNGIRTLISSISIAGLASSQPHWLLGWFSFQLPLTASAVASRSTAATMLAGALRACCTMLTGM